MNFRTFFVRRTSRLRPVRTFVFFYNWIDKRVGDFVSELEVGAAEWVALIAEQHDAAHVEPAIPLVGGVRPR